MTNDPRIALLLSGGVDSAVAAHVLCAQGLKPDCFYIRIAAAEDGSLDCSAEEDIEMATAIAQRYGLTFSIVDCHKEYWEQVTRYTMDKVREGFTPNPDVMCNRLIKFGAFHEKCGHAYDLIATGHYATTERDERGRTWLCTSPDPIKDQTDFLAQIHPWQLQKALFPIGAMTKEQVRTIAEQEHLINARRKDSQGICFLGKIDYNDYVRRYLGEQQGEVIERETGRKIGTHRGHWFHTIGQRKGLGLGGGPWFVVDKDIQRNIIYVAHGYAPDEAYRNSFHLAPIHWLTIDPTSAENSLATDGTNLNITFKIRHTSDYFPATLNTTTGEIQSATPIHGVAPGQFCVIYDAQHHRCLGSAEIAPLKY